jgi:hypothetical protein
VTRRSTIQVVAAIVILVLTGGIWVTGGGLQYQSLRFYSAAVFLATLALGTWDRYVWHLKVIQRLKLVPRDLRGTWSGTLTSFWEDPETKTTGPAKPAYLVVRQTATTVAVAMFTEESRSSSSLGEVTTVNGQTTLDYIYLNRPDSHLEHKSRMHRGSVALDVSGIPAARLRGRYWTDRDSRGELDFARRVGTVADDYDTAVRLFPKEAA